MLAQVLATNGDFFKFQTLSVYVKFIKLYGWQYLFLNLVLGLLNLYYLISYLDFSYIFGHHFTKREVIEQSKAENQLYAFCNNHDGEYLSEKDIDKDKRKKSSAWKQWIKTQSKRYCAKIVLVISKMFYICISRSWQ